MTAFNDTFNLTLDATRSEMEVGTVAILFNPFKLLEWEGVLFQTEEYSFEMFTSNDDSFGYLDLYKNSEFIEYEELNYNEWKLAILSIQNCSEFAQMQQQGLVSQIFNLPTSIRAS